MVLTTPQSDCRIVTPRISCSWGLADGTAYQVVLWWPDRRGTSVMTVTDVNEMGTAKAAEMALSLAWDGCDAVYLSFDIDCIDAGFVPGTGSPEPGGLLPREALDILRRVAREGVCAMDVVEISPPYDNSDITAQVGTRAIMDVLSSMVATGRLGHRSQELVDDVDLG